MLNSVYVAASLFEAQVSPTGVEHRRKALAGIMISYHIGIYLRLCKSGMDMLAPSACPGALLVGDAMPCSALFQRPAVLHD